MLGITLEQFKAWAPLLAFITPVVGVAIAGFISLGNMKARLTNNEKDIGKLEDNFMIEGAPVFKTNISCGEDQSIIGRDFCRKYDGLKKDTEKIREMVEADSKQISKLVGSVETLIKTSAIK